MLDFGFYNMDCMAGMAEYPDKYFDLAIVDPPYGGNDAIGLKDNNNLSKQAANRKAYKVFENVAPTQEYFDELKRVSKRQIIWGVNFYEAKGLRGGVSYGINTVRLSVGLRRLIIQTLRA